MVTPETGMALNLRYATMLFRNILYTDIDDLSELLNVDSEELEVEIQAMATVLGRCTVEKLES